MGDTFGGSLWLMEITVGAMTTTLQWLLLLLLLLLMFGGEFANEKM
jgi:hypothetical protein